MSTPSTMMTAVLEEDLVFILEESLRDTTAKRKKTGAGEFEETVISPARKVLREAQEAAGAAPTSAGLSVRATAHYNLGVALSASGIADKRAEDLQEGAAELREARDDYRACGDTGGLLKALINLGGVRFREAKLLNEGEPLAEGYDSFEAAATLCAETGETLWLAKVRYNQGLMVLFTAHSNPDCEWFGRAAGIFEAAREKFTEAGDKEGELRARVNRAVSLATRACITRDESDLQKAIESAVDAADLATREADPLQSGMARFHHALLLCRRVELATEQLEADIKETIELTDAAAKDFHDAGAATKRAKTRELKRFVLEELAPAVKFDKPPSSVPSRGGQEKDEQIPREPGAATEIKVGDDFAGASRAELLEEIARLRELAGEGHSTTPAHDYSSASLEDLTATLEGGSSVAPEGLVERLEELVKDAQQSPPSDRHGFAASVNELLDGYSLRFELEDNRLARLKVTPTSKAGTLQFSVPRGGSRGFKKVPPKIVPIYLQNRELRTAPEL